MELELGGIVLAGGRSSRMGCEKALLEWEGEPLVQRAVRLLQTVCVDVLVVTASEAVREAVTVRTVADEWPGLGPVGGLHAGLRAATREYNGVVACDMPWINPAALRYLAQWAPGHDAVALRRAPGWEPRHALYARRSLPFLEAGLFAQKLKLTDLCERLHTWGVTEAEWQRFDPDFRAFRNLNTPADYICALAENVE
jgi:molybdopterin-guanine dinucleotide biosynthesis protein A